MYIEKYLQQVHRIVAFEPYKKVEITTLTTDDEDINLIEMTSRKATYTYQNKTKDIDIRTDAAFIFNGKACDFDIDAFFEDNIFTGAIKFIDNGDGVSCVVIDYYQNILIESVVQDGNLKIFDKLSKTEFNLSNAELIYENPEYAADVSELKRGMYCVIHLSRNKSGDRLCRIYVVTETIEGKPTHKSDDKITINGVEYGVAKELVTEPLLGYEYKFYVNPYNEIVGYEDNINSVLFGVYLSCYVDEEEVVWIKLIGQTGEIYKYPCKQKFILDGNKQTDSVTAESLIITVSARTAVRYKLNDNDEITMLDTIIVGAQNSNDNIKCISKLDDGGYAYSKSTGMIRKNGANMYYINPNGYMFTTVPAPRNSGDVTCVINSSIASNLSVKWSLYSLSSNDSIADVVVLEDSSTTGGYGGALIFKGMYVELDPKTGEPRDYVSGYTPGGKKISYPVSEYITEAGEAVLKVLQPGDFIKPKLRNNEISDVQCTYFHGDNNIRGTKTSLLNSSTFISGDNDQEYRTVIGYIKEFPEGYPSLIKIAVGSMDGACEYILVNGVSVTVVDKSSRVVIETDYPVENLRVGDFILFDMSYAALTGLIIYR